jgi:hypothetical protein
MKDKTPEEAVLKKLGRGACFLQRCGAEVNRISTDDGKEMFCPHTARRQNNGFPTS